MMENFDNDNKNNVGSYDNQKINWDEIEEEYYKDNYPPFGGPFTDAMKPFEWLRLYYNAPNRKK